MLNARELHSFVKRFDKAADSTPKIKRIISWHYSRSVHNNEAAEMEISLYEEDDGRMKALAKDHFLLNFFKSPLNFI